MKTPTNCLVCFKPLGFDGGLVSLLRPRRICHKCFSQFEVLYQRIQVEELSGLVLYRYNDFLRQLIYQYKGAYDVVLKDVFVDFFREELQAKYLGFTLVPIPSTAEDDLARGFNHVEEICSSLGLRMAKLLRKNQKWKQSDHSFEERKKIRQVLERVKVKPPKRILLVDDVITSGNTLLSASRLFAGEDVTIQFLAIASARRPVK